MTRIAALPRSSAGRLASTEDLHILIEAMPLLTRRSLYFLSLAGKPEAYRTGERQSRINVDARMLADLQ